jgi:hypothetical protein
VWKIIVHPIQRLNSNRITNGLNPAMNEIVLSIQLFPGNSMKMILPIMANPGGVLNASFSSLKKI